MSLSSVSQYPVAAFPRFLHQKWLDQCNELPEWIALLNEAKNAPWLHKNPDSLMKCFQEQFKVGGTSWKGLESGVIDLFKSPACKIIEKTFRNHVSPKAALLELGSNVIDERGNSRLSSMIPSEWVENLIFSDYLPSVVEAEGKKTERKYRQINAKKLSKDFPNNHLDGIIALSVLDVIARSKISKVAKEVFTVLKEGGHFIIFADRMPYLIPLLEKHFDSSSFAICWFDGMAADYRLRGVKKAPRAIVEANIKNLLPQVSPKWQEFFTQLLSLTPAQMLWFFTDVYDKSPEVFHILESFFPKESTELIELEQSYEKDVVEALKATGFVIKESAKWAANFFSPEELVINGSVVMHATYDMGRISYHNLKNASQEGHLLTATMHVIVAQKV